MPPKIKTREIEAKDIKHILEIYRPYILDSPVSFETEVPSIEIFSSRVAQTLKRWPFLVAYDEGSCLGYAYATQHRSRDAYRWSVDSSVYVAPQHQGRGIGRRLYSTLIKILKYQRFETVLAGITLPNEASVCLHESSGFRKIGIYPKVGYKLGAWHDVAWWSLALQPEAHALQEPLLYSDLDIQTKTNLCQN